MPKHWSRFMCTLCSPSIFLYNHSCHIRGRHTLRSKGFVVTLMCSLIFSLTFISLCLYTGTGTGFGVIEGATETASQLGGSHKNKDWNDS